MPREARSKYENNFFHVMTQGINKENIFYNDKYKRIYIKFLFDNAKKYNIKIIAYCIMINHAHLLLEINDIKEMSKFMKMVNMKYAMLYIELDKILNGLNERISKQEYEKVSFIDTEEDKKTIINKSMTRIIDDFRNEHNMVEINLQNKEILRQLIVKIKEETKADNTEIAKMFRSIKIYSL